MRMSTISSRTKMKERPRCNIEESQLPVKLDICLSNKETYSVRSKKGVEERKAREVINNSKKFICKDWLRR